MSIDFSKIYVMHNNEKYISNVYNFTWFNLILTDSLLFQTFSRFSYISFVIDRDNDIFRERRLIVTQYSLYMIYIYNTKGASCFSNIKKIWKVEKKCQTFQILKISYK